MREICIDRETDTRINKAEVAVTRTDFERYT